MAELKNIIAANITALRRESGMTQAELAAQLNYSDKAVSKWERGESVPDIGVLAELAELFGVTVDYLIRESHETDPLPAAVRKRKLRNRMLISVMSVLGVWSLVLGLFLVLKYSGNTILGEFWDWLMFIYALPVSCIVWLVLNCVWFRGERNVLIVSCLLWTTLLSVHLTLLYFDHSFPLLYVVGAPLQVLVILWFRLSASAV